MVSGSPKARSRKPTKGGKRGPGPNSCPCAATAAPRSRPETPGGRGAERSRLVPRPLARFPGPVRRPALRERKPSAGAALLRLRRPRPLAAGTLQPPRPVLPSQASLPQPRGQEAAAQPKARSARPRARARAHPAGPYNVRRPVGLWRLPRAGRSCLGPDVKCSEVLRPAAAGGAVVTVRGATQARAAAQPRSPSAMCENRGPHPRITKQLLPEKGELRFTRHRARGRSALWVSAVGSAATF